MIGYKLSLYWYETPLTSKKHYLITSLFAVKSKKPSTHLCHFFISSKIIKEYKTKKCLKGINCDALTYTMYIGEYKYTYLHITKAH